MVVNTGLHSNGRVEASDIFKESRLELVEKKINLILLDLLEYTLPTLKWIVTKKLTRMG